MSMSEVYVTLFDSFFLPQGLALYHSLLRHGGSFRLWVLCVDQECFNFLNSLKLRNLFLLNLSDLETNDLLRIKKDRKRSEYCWTLTPWSIQWALEADLSASRVTYVDADTYFLQSPNPIFHEFERSEKAFLITEHSYSPKYDMTHVSGRFCVQFVPVVRGAGQPLLDYWRDKCMEWCYDRFEDGKFGDQKYIEDISLLFESKVLSLASDGRFLAPWNVDRFPLNQAILYHFHGLRILTTRSVVLAGGYSLPIPVRQYIYSAYVEDLVRIQRLYSPFGFKMKRQLPLSFSIVVRILISFFFSFFDYLRRASIDVIFF